MKLRQNLAALLRRMADKLSPSPFAPHFPAYDAFRCQEAKVSDIRVRHRIHPRVYAEMPDGATYVKHIIADKMAEALVENGLVTFEARMPSPDIMEYDGLLRVVEPPRQ